MEGGGDGGECCISVVVLNETRDSNITCYATDMPRQTRTEERRHGEARWKGGKEEKSD